MTSYFSFATRWGDYTGISVDPIDDLCFWVYNQYANATNAGVVSNWGTAHGNFCVDPEHIPTLTHWGLIIIGITLLILGVVFIGQRRAFTA